MWRRSTLILRLPATPCSWSIPQARNRRLTVAWMALFILFFAWLGFGGYFALYLAAAART